MDAMMSAISPHAVPAQALYETRSHSILSAGPAMDAIQLDGVRSTNDDGSDAGHGNLTI